MSPATRFDQGVGPYRLVDGTIVASDWADLTDGTLDAPIDHDQNGGTPGGSGVWTAVAPDGTLSAANTHCGDWTGSGLGGVGRFTDTGATWTQESLDFCTDMRRLYCFEQ